MLTIKTPTHYLMAGTLILLMACNGSASNESSNNAPAAYQQPSEVSNTYETTEEPTEEPVIETITREEAIKFVEIWSNIYSTNTLSSYINLYNKNRFKGIKRTTDGQTNVYNYSGWIANKRNEFSKYKPTVDVSDVMVTSLNINGKTIVQFTQVWYSNHTNYSDMGTKTMTLRKINGQILIEHEELLYSQELPGC